jgi:CRP-like cAMP-binding protein
LQGQSEVLSWNGTEYIKVADLKPGDIAGEISLIYDEDATATVRTVSRSTLLFLARELFKPLVEAYPELLKYFAKMANARVADTGEKLEAEKIASGDGIENVDESDDDTDIDELSGDDLIMI